MFYHPAVWWVSRDIRQEREHCCDDLAVRACGDRLAYVQALASMEELRMLTAGLTLGAGGGSLFGRVRRLLFPERSESDWRCVAGSTLLLLGLVFTAAGATAWLMSPKHYEASARIQVEPPSGNEWDRAPRSVAPSSPAEMEDYLANAMANLQSRSLIESVAVRRVNRKATEPLPKLDDSAISLVVDDISARIRVRRPLWTSQLELTVSADTPREAADLANALADELIEQNLLRHQKVMLEQLFFLRSQATALEAELAKASDVMQQYRRERGFVSIGKGESGPAQTLAAAQLQYGESVSRCRSAATTVEELERHLRDGKSVDTFPPLAADPQLRQVRLDLIRMETELPGLLKGFAEEHPQVQQARARIQATREALERLGRDSIEVLRAQARLARLAEQTQKELVDRWAAE